MAIERDLEAVQVALAELRGQEAPAAELLPWEEVFNLLAGRPGFFDDATMAVKREKLAQLVERVIPRRVARGEYEVDVDWTPLGGVCSAWRRRSPARRDHPAARRRAGRGPGVVRPAGGARPPARDYRAPGALLAGPPGALTTETAALYHARVAVNRRFSVPLPTVGQHLGVYRVAVYLVPVDALEGRKRPRFGRSTPRAGRSPMRWVKADPAPRRLPGGAAGPLAGHR